MIKLINKIKKMQIYTILVKTQIPKFIKKMKYKINLT